MKTVDATRVSAASLDKLDALAEELPETDLKDALFEMSTGARAGQNVMVVSDGTRLSPAAAASILGISRTHLYKVMDSGEIPWTAVGRDRRIEAADVKAYLDAQDAVRKATAERFAHPGDVRRAALEKFKEQRRQSD